jgi:adenosylcobinamide kinase/adenosylcobinamide-phosphate guanylyltransferase
VRALVLGGTRSGKSAHAESLVSGNVTYVATGRRRADDPEWMARITAHEARRPANWHTVETVDLVTVLADTTGPVLVDDVATWVSAMMEDTVRVGTSAPEGGDRGVAAVSESVRDRGEALVAAVAARHEPVVLVSAEVGLGVVPGTAELLVAGIPLRLR